ncbi:ATP-dependent zinc protease family protein [Taklimakanibacter deserti]|uniref:ATP-dependent zinc protease family protein n=1 Tax=Taklimakanibacter deserti TaxID=2267839 RepID=UPI000E647A61
MTHEDSDRDEERTLIGWQETVSLPELGAGPIVAKIDTGARSAALHADDIRITGRGKRMKVRFKVQRRGSSSRRIECEMPLHDLRRVKSSNGQIELRAVIATPVEIGGQLLEAEITLTQRSDMGAAMLIGRSSIKGNFLVDPSRTFLRSRRPRKTKPR